MNKLNLQIKSKALEDMEKIADYIEKDNQKAALDLLKFFYTSFDNICSFPHIGCIRKDFTYKNVRFLQVKQNYLIVYNVEKEAVCILRVLSNYQEICNLL